MYSFFITMANIRRMFCNRVAKKHFYLCFHSEMNDMAKNLLQERMGRLLEEDPERNPEFQ